jgi:hypothetical protein
MTAKQNLRTATKVKCPTCGVITTVTTDDDDQQMCQWCGENVGWTFGKMWEEQFDTFYSGDVPPAYQVS